jgi:diguanylate cyclase (GGDEF)-like protein
MNWQILATLGPYFISALISILAGVYALRRRAVPGATALAVMALLEAWWTLAYVGQLLSSNLGAVIFWNDLQFLGAVLVPLAFFEFSARFAGRRVSFSPWIRRVLAAAAAIMLLIIWTDGIHHLFRVLPHLDTGDLFPALVFTNGPLFALYPFVGYIPLLLGIYALTVAYISAPRIFRLQAAAVLVSTLIPWITTIITWLEVIPFKLHELTPLTFGISNLVVAWALFRYGLFDLVPAAHATLVEFMEDGVIVLDAARRIVDLNPAAQRILNLDLSKALGLVFPGGVPALAGLVPGLERPGLLPRQLDLAGPAGQRNYEVSISDLPDVRLDSAGVLIQLRDVTHRRQVEEHLHHLAITDPLTGVFNRRHFLILSEHELEHTRRSGQPLSVLLLDIDYLKQVNDSFGHLVGDMLLQELCRRCQENLRSYDVFARYGGDEFIFLLPESGPEQSLGTGDRLRMLLHQPMQIQGMSIQVSISLGIATSRGEDGLSIATLIERADQALYRAKRSGRNQVCLEE